MSNTTKKFNELLCKMNPILKSLCENECMFRNKHLKRFTCKIIPKDQYCVRPLCHKFVLDPSARICICNNSKCCTDSFI